MKVVDLMLRKNERNNSQNFANNQNLTVVNNIHVEKTAEKTAEKNVDVKYPENVLIPEPIMNTNDLEKFTLMQSNEQLILYNKQLQTMLDVNELIFKIMIDNPLFINKIAIANQNDLVSLINLLTEQDVKLILSEENIKCCGKKTDYDIIDEIQVVDKVSKRLLGNLKYEFNNVYILIKSKNISLKFTR